MGGGRKRQQLHEQLLSNMFVHTGVPMGGGLVTKALGGSGHLYTVDSD